MDQANLAGHPTATAGHAFPLLCDFVRASVSSSVTAVVTGPGKQGAEISEKGDVRAHHPAAQQPGRPPSPQPWSPIFSHISWRSRNGPGHSPCPAPRLPPWLALPQQAGDVRSKVKAMSPLGVIEDDGGTLGLTETGRDQRRHAGAAATDGNSPANATNYRKWAAVVAITV